MQILQNQGEALLEFIQHLTGVRAFQDAQQIIAADRERNHRRTNRFNRLWYLMIQHLPAGDARHAGVAEQRVRHLVENAFLA